MKKLLTLLIAFSSFSVVSVAQSRKIDEARRVMNGTPDDRTVYDEKSSRVPGSTSRNESIESINSEYDRKIAAVRMNPTLSQAEKERRIRDLELQRERRLNRISSGKDYNTGKKTAKNKGNNGKHLGWEKGVGNPHRSDGSYERRGKNDDNGSRNNYSKSKQKNKKK